MTNRSEILRAASQLADKIEEADDMAKELVRVINDCRNILDKPFSAENRIILIKDKLDSLLSRKPYLSDES